MRNFKQIGIIFTIIFILFAGSVFAQTSGFVYQGKLQDGGAAANGTYQFEFKLFDAAAGGNQIGQTLSGIPATVTNGIFAVTLDFGASAFDGSARYLEISVRLNGSGQAYTLLNPRQAVTSTPYAVRSLNANQAVTADNSANLGGIPAAQYTQTNDPRLSDDRNPLPNSPNYIQNTTAPQASSNFNVSGTGKANVLEAKTQFNINGERVFHITGASNVFAGVNAGKNTTGFANAFFGFNAGYLNTTGQDNSFFGQSAGVNNTSGNANSFFGNGAGFYNTTGVNNAYYGYLAGSDNTTGGYNAFFGSTSGNKNTTGQDNAFFGQASGFKNTVGSSNAFFGNGAGLKNTTGSNNVFLGALSGDSNTVENNNIFIGYKADGTAGITNAAAIGANSKATQSNTIVLGTAAVTVQVPGNLTVANTFSANALNSATNYQIGGVRIFHKTGNDNLFAGIDAGNVTTGGFNAFFGAQSGKFNTTGFNNTFIGAYAGRDNTTGSNNAFFGANAGLSNTTAVGNSFFGSNAGFTNSTGAGNSFFGNLSGFNNTTGSNNSFLGAAAGQANTTGANNAFFGFNSGLNNVDGISNSFFGSNSGKANTTGDNNAFFGYNAGTGNTTGGSNSFFGNASGQSNTTGLSNVFLGANAGLLNTTGSFNVFVGRNSATLSTTANNNTFLGYNAGSAITTGGDNVFLGYNAGSTGNVTNSIAIGSGVKVTSSNTALIGTIQTSVNMPGSLSVGKTLSVGDDLTIGGNLAVTGGIDVNGSFSGGTGNFNQLSVSQFLSNGAVMNGQTHITTIIYGNNNGAGGESDFICRSETNGVLLPCFALSNQELKDSKSFSEGMNVLKDLRAVSFNLNGETRRSLGLVLSGTGNANSLFAKPGAGSFVTGRRYFEVVAALVDAAQQQQTQIEEQQSDNRKLQEQVKTLQTELAALKAIVCASNSAAAVCQPK